MLDSFSLLSQDLMIEILSSLSMTDLTRFLGCSKEMMQWNVPTFQDQLLMQRTDAQVQAVFEEAAGLNMHALVGKLLQQPRFLARLGETQIATTFLQAVRIRRSIARVIMPFCRCSVMKTSLDVLRVCLKDPNPLNLRKCELQVHGSDSSIKFTANMKPTRNPGSLDCLQWPLDFRGDTEGVIFWLNAPKDSEEWTEVTINVGLEHAWLTLRCEGIPEV